MPEVSTFSIVGTCQTGYGVSIAKRLTLRTKEQRPGMESDGKNAIRSDKALPHSRILIGLGSKKTCSHNTTPQRYQSFTHTTPG